MDDFTPTAHLLAGQDGIVSGAVDYKGRPVLKSKSGGWKSVVLIIGLEVAETFTYYGIGCNLITYLSGPLRQQTSVAAENVNAWYGTAYLLPLLGGLLADSYVGRYRMIVGATLLYILGLVLLVVSASATTLRPADCVEPLTSCPSLTPLQIIFFFTALYLVALAQGGHRPCIQAFGADQFDPTDPQEMKSKSSFFNWWYFGLHTGTCITLVIVPYIQDNVSWGLGFGIPCIAMALGLCFFLLGTPIYRYTLAKNKRPICRISQAIIGAYSSSTKRRISTVEEIESETKDGGSSKNCRVTYSINSVQEVQLQEPIVSQLVYILLTCLIYALVYAQTSTFFVKQGSTMDRRIFNTQFQIPSASLQILISLSVIMIIPIYDRLIVPSLREITELPSGLTMLQRIGIGLFFSILSMVAAAIVERQRLMVARAPELVYSGELHDYVPMSVLWLAPQYVLFGISDVFAMVGLQEFCYDQMPDELRSVGVALYVSIFGVGNWVSGILIAAIDKLSDAHGRSWFTSNLNQAHLDYFYWLLAGLSAVELGIYMYFAKSYVYRTRSKPCCES